MKLPTVFAAIGETTRLGILRGLGSGMASVTDLGKMLNCEIVNVSHHLGILKMAGLVVPQRVARFQMYSLTPEFWKVEAGKIVLTVPGAKLELDILTPTEKQS